FEFYAGHYFRDIPEGYLETISTGQNQLTDPILRPYYDRLSLAIRGPLFSGERLSAIWYLLAGEGRSLASRVERQRPISVSIRADNERFSTDAGERDPGAGVIRSDGRAGYLQSGPGIPMAAGVYRARWMGGLAPAARGAERPL